ncbi:MAG: hypothetical protein LBV13_01115 [Methanomassiliicoccaceae archaeon]|jgi:hypothetical protein|nr:hypothetical protein [Methanomassiliicoccaceae archaeon]
MKNAGNVLVVLAVIILSAVGFVALEAVLEKENSHVDGDFDFALTTTASFQTPNGDVNAPEGRVYVVADILLRNMDWHTGLSDGPSNFELVIEGGNITTSSDTYDHPEHLSERIYMPGEKGRNLYLFIVPSDIDLSNAKIIYTGLDKVVHNPGLLAES